MNDPEREPETHPGSDPDPASAGGAEPERRRRGREVFTALEPDAAARRPASLATIAPDLANYLLEFPFGDIYSRPGLSLRDRQIATIAALAALGNARPQLEIHIAGGLNAGLDRAEIVEILMQMAVYAGFPAAINGLAAARDVFARRDAADAEAAKAAGDG